jgi:methylated-DNA-protein-cysteine methyltransferase-like protein
MDKSAVFERVYETLGQVPCGKVVTYGQIARHLGMPHGARVVGWALKQCPEGLPWHRVVNARGAVSPRGGTLGEPYQRDLLEDEGVAFGASGCVDLAVYGWDEI